MTQWIFDTSRCSCSNAPVESVVRCVLCGLPVKSRLGSITQWIFKPKVCSCLVSYETDAYLDPTTLPADESIPGAPYHFLGVTGRGGVGTVYKAQNKKLGRAVAIKVLQTGLEDTRAAQNFEREARACSKLQHPNIVTVQDFGTMTDGRQFLVSEWIEGITLAQYLSRNGRLPLEIAQEIFLQVLDGLSHAHKKHVIHRDIKPDNIMLTRGDYGGWIVKIIDFGTAKEIDNKGEVTRAEDLPCSPFYMSPEQSFCSTLDHRTDFYSLGCSFFEVLTGRPPFTGKPLTVLMRHQSEPPPTLSIASGGVVYPQYIEELIARLLAKEPEDRFESAEEVKNALSPKRRGLMAATMGGGDRVWGGGGAQGAFAGDGSAIGGTLRGTLRGPGTAGFDSGDGLNGAGGHGGTGGRVVVGADSGSGGSGFGSRGSGGSGISWQTPALALFLLIPVCVSITMLLSPPSENRAKVMRLKPEPFRSEKHAPRLSTMRLASAMAGNSQWLGFDGAWTDITGTSLLKIPASKVKELKLVEWQDLTGLSGFRNLEAFGISLPETSELKVEDVNQLVSLKRVNFVKISAVRVPKDLCARIATLPHLEHFEISSCEVTKEHLLSIAKMRGLRTLNIGECGVQDKQYLGALKFLTKLEFFGAGHIAATDEFVNWMPHIPYLSSIDISQSRLSFEGWRNVAKCQNLQAIRSPISSLDNRGAKELSKMSNLLRLDIRSCAITDEGLLALVGSKSLRSIDVEGCKEITSDGVTKARSLNPKCDVKFAEIYGIQEMLPNDQELELGTH